MRFRDRHGGVGVEGRDGQDVVVLKTGRVGLDYGHIVRFGDGHTLFAHDDELEAAS